MAFVLHTMWYEDQIWSKQTSKFWGNRQKGNNWVSRTHDLFWKFITEIAMLAFCRHQNELSLFYRPSLFGLPNWNGKSPDFTGNPFSVVDIFDNSWLLQVGVRGSEVSYHFFFSSFLSPLNCLQLMTIPHMCQFWYTTALFRPVKVHQKVCKFATKKRK